MDWFPAFVLWMVEPLHVVVFAWVCGVGTGWIIGRSGKTRKLEIERDVAKDDLQSILRTFELKQKHL